VVAADTGRPLRRARITIQAAELGQDGRKVTSTDLSGRFEFTEVRGARYRIFAARGGYLQLDYGQRRPGEQGRPLQVGDGEVVEKIDFALPRMSVISGRVLDETGEPMEGVRVFAMRSMFFDGRRRMVPVNGSGSIATDETGTFRVTRMPPGSYYVQATTRETWTTKENGVDRVLGYVPTYAPSVTMAESARRVTLGVGQEVSGVDVMLVPGRAARVAGIALDSAGRPFKRVTLRDEVRGLNFASFGGGPDVAVNPDGSFSAKEVPPGDYVLTATRGEEDTSGPPEAAELPITVDSIDIEGLTLRGSGGGIISSRVRFEGQPPPRLNTVRLVVAQPLRGQPSPNLLGLARGTAGPGAGYVGEDGAFELQRVFGPARFQMTLPDGWMVKSVTAEGREISDDLFELRSGEEIRNVEVVVTDQVSKLEGQLLDAKNQPLRDATVLIFSADRNKWFETSRSVRATRPDQQGKWQIRGLPNGEYAAVALDYVEDRAWDDPEFLEGLQRYGRKVSITDGASQSVPLKLTVQESQ
jgi:protocatechuate 3,4-dioxygenase beta subunit